MPELFGVSWGMYAVLGGLVVMLMLVLVMSRSQRRKKAGGSTKPVKEPKASKSAQNKPPKTDKRARYADLQQRAAMEEPDSGFAQSPYATQTAGLPAGATVAGVTANLAAGAAVAGVAAAAPLGAPQAAPQAAAPIGTVPTGTVPQQVAPAAPAPRMESIPMEQFIPGSDPLQIVFFDILSGWGDITQDDTNRLAVFRPDRVLALLATAELPKELKSNDQARARLSQLRRWGSGLEQSMKAAQAQAQLAAQQEYAGMAVPAAPAAATAAAAPQPAAPQPLAPQPVTAPMQAPAVQAGPPPMAAPAAPGAGTGALAGAAALGGAAVATGHLGDRSSFYGSAAAGAPGAPLVSPVAQPVELAPAQPTTPIEAPAAPQAVAPQAPSPAQPVPVQPEMQQPVAEPAWQPAWDDNGLNGAAATAAAPLVPPAPVAPLAPVAPVAPAAPAPEPGMTAGLAAGLGAAAFAGAAAAQQQAAPEPQPMPVAAPMPEPMPVPEPMTAPEPMPAPVPEPMPVPQPMTAPEPMTAPQPAPVPPVADAPVVSAADARRAQMDDVSRSADAAIAAAAAAFWAKADAGLVPQQDTPAPGPVAPAAEDNFLVDLGGGVSTAAGLLTLPPDEQAITLAFLQPGELEKVINGEGDVELKRATIDQLKSIGSPAARDIIYRTLDHSDPQVQAKALDAADKLLGADQEGRVESLGPGD